MMKKIFLVFIFLSILISSLISVPAAAEPDNKVYIDRKNKVFYLMSSDGNIIMKDGCGIGRGGLGDKTNMQDQITPTGDFAIDLILYRDPAFNQISESNREKYKNNKSYSDFVASSAGLANLFKNMSEIDFNGDGKSDAAYGAGYIGLDSASAVTGPKMSIFKKTPYWFSIALHGTPDQSNIGNAMSGGCIHLSEKTLEKLIQGRLLDIGTQVKIADGPPVNK